MSSNDNLIADDGRHLSRQAADIQSIVQVKEGDGTSWKEVTVLSTVSLNGAGFTLTRPVTLGRLVSMVLPMPRNLRAYDHDKELYPALGLVQHCTKTRIDGETKYRVGVGFIGKEVPESFKKDPTQSYLFTGIRPDGLWMVLEANSQFKQRGNPRFWKHIEFTVTKMRRERSNLEKVTAMTNDISAGGFSITGDLNVEIGERVKAACPIFGFYTFAEIRNISVSKKDNRTTLHLKFLDYEFPMERLLARPRAASNGHHR
ncbi:MAG: PilZ domain-containing protein [Chloracidobacterium sp.]|nr:PilZ domain-containing protein [Chloracidobacterium sp.]MCC6826289.1 PilZ domain-containing protein [Acidobacteriota bacterium]MCO5333035.1 PilZ domain-containing protein [Pyrinomonadaceae bacterium]